MPAKQTIVVKTTTRSRTRRNKNNGKRNKKGNPNRCPSCGRFM